MRSITLLLLLLPLVPLFPSRAQAAVPGRQRSYRLVLDPSGKGRMEAGVVLASDASALLYRGFMEGADAAGVNARWYLRPLMLPAVAMGLPSPGNFIHEYYGHGAALREYGFESGTKYKWGWFLGATGSAENRAVQNSGNYEALQAWTAGGLAATQLYLLDYEKEMYRSGRIDLLAAKPLFAASTDLGYIHDGLDPAKDPNTASNDATSWLNNLKGRHPGSLGVKEDFASKSRKAVEQADTLDPAKYWAVVTVLHYLWTGNDGFYAPALPVAGLRLGFSPKVNLTPIGPENYYYLFIARGGKLASLYLRRGEAPEGETSGFGAELGPVNLFGVGLTPGYDKWELPPAPDLPGCRSGYGAHLRLDLPVYRALGLTGKAAYKTEGYLLGQPAGEGYYGYAGLSLTF